jgi:hypothetical protein
MKRIDEKIKEIEKKDKSSRILYIAFIGVILVAMAIILSQIKGINERDVIISDNEIELTIKNQELEKQRDSISAAYIKLNNSLSPDAYWNYIEQQNNHESYISYLTNNWTIKKPERYIDKAIKNINLLNGKKHLKGFIHAGVTSGGVYNPQMDNGKYLLKIIWRKDSDNFDEKTLPKPGDIVQLLSPINRRTYKTKKTTGLLKRPNDEGWRPGTKAYVTKVEEDGSETKIEIRYY